MDEKGDIHNYCGETLEEVRSGLRGIFVAMILSLILWAFIIGCIVLIARAY